MVICVKSWYKQYVIFIFQWIAYTQAKVPCNFKIPGFITKNLSIQRVTVVSPGKFDYPGLCTHFIRKRAFGMKHPVVILHQKVFGRFTLYACCAGNMGASFLCIIKKIFPLLNDIPTWKSDFKMIRRRWKNRLCNSQIPGWCSRTMQQQMPVNLRAVSFNLQPFDSCAPADAARQKIK